jgi:thiamine-phosphate pyrophosphorylase
VQLRGKGLDRLVYAELAKEVVAAVRPSGVTIIVNDDPEVARLSEADGVHLGRGDASPEEARRILGADAIVGVTINGDEDMERLERIIRKGGIRIDYAGVGPYRATRTKQDHAAVLGHAGIARLVERAQKMELPMIAIGGIMLEDCSDLLRSGASGVAVASSINEASDPRRAVRRFLAALGDCGRSEWVNGGGPVE